jgi:hypothetical protein
MNSARAPWAAQQLPPAPARPPALASEASAACGAAHSERAHHDNDTAERLLLCQPVLALALLTHGSAPLSARVRAAAAQRRRRLRAQLRLRRAELRLRCRQQQRCNQRGMARHGVVALPA